MRIPRQSLFYLVAIMIGLVLGWIAGFISAYHLRLRAEWPLPLQLSFVATDSIGSAAPQITLRLLDLCEEKVREQMSIPSQVDWNQELVEINLRRYLVYSRDHRDDVAEQMLVRAATLFKKGGTPTNDDLEMLRKVAVSAYSPKPKRDEERSP
jgi:hypothetical protein